MTSQNRRHFIHQLSALSGLATLSAQTATANAPALKLGFDNFSIRALNWKAPQLINYAQELKVDALLLSDLDVYENHTTPYLKDIGKKATDAGLELHVGTLCVCPTAKRFNAKYGTAEELLRLLLRVAHDTGSKVARCVLGFGEDRQSEGGIEARIADTVTELKKVRSQALDHGIFLAVENHGGDMQGWELRNLIEAAGPEFVGATIDPGNSTWTMETPADTCEELWRYAKSSGFRDSMLWTDGDGAVNVQWTALGDGLVDWASLFASWQKNIPDVPIMIETISGFPKAFSIQKDDFFQPYEKIRAHGFTRWQKLAQRGGRIPPFKASAELSDADFQKQELLRSLSYAREKLALGRRR
jgi:3-oxoisoapionate decarboxylase